MNGRDRRHSGLDHRQDELMRQAGVLVDLAKRLGRHRRDLLAAVQEVVVASTSTLGVERSSVWLYDEARTAIQCFDMYEGGARIHSQGIVLTASEYPAYFQALEEERVIAADDARHDPRTIEFADTYLDAHGITSMLDAPIRLHGEMIGVICNEHTGEQRSWTPNEQSFAGSLADLVSLAIETNDRTRAEDALRESEAMLKSVLDNTRALVTVKDLEGRYVLVNRRFEDLVHRGRDEVLGVGDSALFPATVAESLRANDERVVREHRPLDFEESLPHEDGIHTYVTVKVPLDDATGETYGVCAISTDISERLRIEAELRQSQKLEAIGRLAGGIAHDFNNLLTVILGNVECVRDDPEFKEIGNMRVAADLREVAEAGERAAALTHQLLAFGRRQVRNPRSIDLGGVIERLEPMLRRLIREDIELALDLDPGAGHAFADTSQTEQVIMNLAVNASDAMPDGGSMTIGTRAVVLRGAEAHQYGLEPGEYVEVRVSDSGCGMEEGVLSRIFDPFFTTKEPGQGTGLGLATVHGIVTQSGGGIAVDSRPGVGTTFRVWMPRETPRLTGQGA